MSNAVGDLAGVVAGFKAGQITEREARRLLREFGTGDSTIDGLLAAGAGIVGGILVGDIVADAATELLTSLFD